MGHFIEIAAIISEIFSPFISVLLAIADYNLPEWRHTGAIIVPLRAVFELLEMAVTSKLWQIGNSYRPCKSTFTLRRMLLLCVSLDTHSGQHPPSVQSYGNNGDFLFLGANGASYNMIMIEKLRKYGLDRQDFPTLVANISLLLRLLTFNIDSRPEKRVPLICYFMMLVSLVSYVYVFQVSVFIMIFDGTEEFLKKIVSFSQCVTTLVSVVKFLYMYWNKNKLKLIVEAYLIVDSSVAPSSRMSRNIDTALRVVKKRALILWIVVACNVVIYVLIRPLVMDRHSMIDYPQLWGLEPMVETPNFEISVTVMTTIVPIVVLAPIHIAILLIIVVGYSEAQMLALSEELLSLWKDSETDYLQSSDENKHLTSIDDFVKRRLEFIIKCHAQNKQLIQSIEDAFRNATSFQFMTLSIALVADLVGGLGNTYMQIPFAAVLVGMDCFTGQNLIDASLAFEAAVYRCKWEKFNKTNRKLVLMMLQNAQKSMQLTAGGVASLNYACLMYIIKSIYSVYAALQ